MKKYFQNFYYPLFIFALLIAAIGLINLYSATTTIEDPVTSSLFKAQFMYTLLGIVVMFAVSNIHVKYLLALSPYVYFISLIILVLVFVMGVEVHGALGWLDFGLFRVQPSEFAKLGLIFILSRHLAGLQMDTSLTLRDLVFPLLLFAIPTVMVILQNDLGSSLFYGFLFMTLIMIQGVRSKLIIIGLVLVVLTGFLSYQFLLQPYQKNRIVSFMEPERDPRGSGYHLVQSKIAVGSGGMTGKGYMKGESHRLKFLPERHTDFIFPVLAEEWGFVGGAITLFLYFLFLMSGIQVATRTETRFGFFLCMGLTSFFFWHLVINLGGVLGLLPLTGVPLPLLSYGGSSLITNWMAIGFLLAVMKSRTYYL